MLKLKPEMQEYFPNAIARDLLATQKLDRFDTLWELDAGWFEEPNKRRGGWSGVSRYLLPDGSAVFLKRQQNHFYRTWRNFFMPAATFSREFKNILNFKKHGIPTLELIYFGQRKQAGNLQAILVTRELEGFLQLDNKSLLMRLKNNVEHRKGLLQKVAEILRHLHDSHMQHNCLYPKHVFVKILPDGMFDVRLIDLEKAKWRPLGKSAMLRDLGTLHRHTTGWSNTDRMRLFLTYRQEQRLSAESKKILFSILKLKKRKPKPVIRDEG